MEPILMYAFCFNLALAAYYYIMTHDMKDLKEEDEPFHKNWLYHQYNCSED